MKIYRRIIAFILSCTIIVSGFGVLSFAKRECDDTPIVIVPGLFQCEYKYYEDGQVALKKDGTEYTAPFFLDDSSELVKYALSKVLLPLLSTLIFQRDINNKLAENLGDAATHILADKIKSDDNGKFVNDIRPTIYPDSVADCADEEKAFIYNKLPLEYFTENISEDHIFFFSYCSFGNMIETVGRLYEYIQHVKEKTGHDKVNLVPISQGGSIVSGLMGFYPQVAEDIERMVFVVPAFNGSTLIGGLFESGVNVSDENLYCDMMPKLVEENYGMTGYLLNFAIRILPNKVLKNVLQTTFDNLIDNGLKNCTLLWGLCPEENYLSASDRRLSSDNNAEIKRQTDLYYNKCQKVRYDNLKMFINKGVEIFDVVDYNDYLYPLVDDWKSINSDGIIQLDGASFGATTFGVNEKLPEGYKSEVNNCTNPTVHNHTDPNGIVDPLTGLIPDRTFYFYNQNHESTAHNDIIIKLISKLSTDKNFKDVFTYPDVFPQFNTGRNLYRITNSKKLLNKYMDENNLTNEQIAEIKNGFEVVDKFLEDTVYDYDEYLKVEKDFVKLCDKYVKGKTEADFRKDEISDSFNKSLASVLKAFSDITFKLIGGKGFSEL